MAFMVSTSQSSFSEQASEKMRFNNNTDESDGKLGSVSTQLSLKPSSQSLDRGVVLRRLRHHKTLNKVKNTFQAVLAGAPLHPDPAQQEEWLQHWDNFTSP